MSKKDKDSAPFAGDPGKGNGFFAGRSTMGKIIGLIKALSNVTFSPSDAGAFHWSANNLVVEIKDNGSNDSTATKVVMIVIDDETGTVKAKQGSIPVSSLEDYTP